MWQQANFMTRSCNTLQKHKKKDQATRYSRFAPTECVNWKESKKCWSLLFCDSQISQHNLKESSSSKNKHHYSAFRITTRKKETRKIRERGQNRNKLGPTPCHWSHLLPLHPPHGALRPLRHRAPFDQSGGVSVGFLIGSNPGAVPWKWPFGGEVLQHWTQNSPPCLSIDGTPPPSSRLTLTNPGGERGSLEREP